MDVIIGSTAALDELVQIGSTGEFSHWLPSIMLFCDEMSATLSPPPPLTPSQEEYVLPLRVTKHDLICCICYEPLLNSIFQCNQGTHHICSTCKSKVRDDRCPIDREPGGFFPDPMKQRIVQQLVKSCPLGCMDVLLPFMVKDHIEQECMHRVLTCFHCKLQVPRLYDHLMTCLSSTYTLTCSSSNLQLWSTVHQRDTQTDCRFLVLTFGSVATRPWIMMMGEENFQFHRFDAYDPTDADISVKPYEVSYRHHTLPYFMTSFDLEPGKYVHVRSTQTPYTWSRHQIVRVDLGSIFIGSITALLKPEHSTCDHHNIWLSLFTTRIYPDRSTETDSPVVSTCHRCLDASLAQHTLIRLLQSANSL
jgi:hypothetical protein